MLNPSACVREKCVQGVWDQWGAGRRQRGQALQPGGHLGTRGFGISEGRMEGEAKNGGWWVCCCESLKWPAESPYLLWDQKHPRAFLITLPSPTLSQLKVHSGETVHQREAEGSHLWVPFWYSKVKPCPLSTASSSQPPEDCSSQAMVLQGRRKLFSEEPIMPRKLSSSYWHFGAP